MWSKTRTNTLNDISYCLTNILTLLQIHRQSVFCTNEEVMQYLNKCGWWIQWKHTQFKFQCNYQYDNCYNKLQYIFVNIRSNILNYKDIKLHHRQINRIGSGVNEPSLSNRNTVTRYIFFVIPQLIRDPLPA